MKRNKLVACLVAMAMTTSFALVGCKGDTKSEAGNTSSSGEPDKEQYLNVLLQDEPKTLDQSKSSDRYSSEILVNVEEGLTRITQDENNNNKIVEGLAEKWEKSDDELTWTFHLRDAKWSDGQAITADQFVYSILRTLDPNTASKSTYLLSPIENADEYTAGEATAEEVGVKAVDDKTLEFKLKTPCPYFLDLTYFKTMQPQRKDIIEANKDNYGTEASTMIFCGPFKLTEWVHSSKAELVKNENYWDAENVKLDKITMKIIAEENSQMQELYNGSLDLAPARNPEWVEKLDETEKYEVFTGGTGSTNYDYYNIRETVNGKKNIFSNAKVRKAFTIANNREETVQTLMKGLGEPAYGFVPPQVQIDGKDYRETVDDLQVKRLAEENPDPKALLIEGLEELGLGSDPSAITVDVLNSGTDSVAKVWAEFSQQNYQNKLGVNIEIEYVDWPTFQTRCDAGEYQMVGQGWGGDYNDPNTFMEIWKSSTKNFNTGWASPEYDKLIEDAAATTDQKERTELFKKAEDLLVYGEAVCNPSAWKMKKTYVRKYINNYKSPLFGCPDYKAAYTSGRSK